MARVLVIVVNEQQICWDVQFLRAESASSNSISTTTWLKLRPNAPLPRFSLTVFELRNVGVISKLRP